MEKNNGWNIIQMFNSKSFSVKAVIDFIKYLHNNSHIIEKIIIDYDAHNRRKKHVEEDYNEEEIDYMVDQAIKLTDEPPIQPIFINQQVSHILKPLNAGVISETFIVKAFQEIYIRLFRVKSIEEITNLIENELYEKLKTIHMYENSLRNKDYFIEIVWREWIKLKLHIDESIEKSFADMVKDDLKIYLDMKILTWLKPINIFDWFYWLAESKYKDENAWIDSEIYSQLTLLLSKWWEYQNKLDWVNKSYEEIIHEQIAFLLHLIEDKLKEINQEKLLASLDTLTWLKNSLWYNVSVWVLDGLWVKFKVDEFKISDDNKLIKKYWTIWKELILKSIWKYLKELDFDNSFFIDDKFIIVTIDNDDKMDKILDFLIEHDFSI